MGTPKSRVLEEKKGISGRRNSMGKGMGSEKLSKNSEVFSEFALQFDL